MTNPNKCNACNNLARVNRSGLCDECEAELDLYIAAHESSPEQDFDDFDMPSCEEFYAEAAD